MCACCPGVVASSPTLRSCPATCTSLQLVLRVRPRPDSMAEWLAHSPVLGPVSTGLLQLRGLWHAGSQASLLGASSLHSHELQQAGLPAPLAPSL